MWFNLATHTSATWKIATTHGTKNLLIKLLHSISHSSVFSFHSQKLPLKFFVHGWDSRSLYFAIRSSALVVFYKKQFIFHKRIYIPWSFNSILIDWPTPYLCPLRQQCLTTTCKGHFRQLMYGGSTVQCCIWQNSNHMWCQWGYCCCHKGMLSLWHQLLFGYGSGKITTKFLTD